MAILSFTKQSIVIDFVGKIANLIQFQSEFSYRQQITMTMPEFTNIQALLGRSSLLLHVTAAGRQRRSRWMVTVPHSHFLLKVWMLILEKFHRPIHGLLYRNAAAPNGIT